MIDEEEDVIVRGHVFVRGVRDRFCFNCGLGMLLDWYMYDPERKISTYQTIKMSCDDIKNIRQMCEVMK